DHDLVDRGTDGSGEALVSLERRHGTGVPDQLVDDLVEVGRGGTGDRGIACGDQRAADDPAGGLHRVEFARGTCGDGTLARSSEHGRGQRPSAESARALISSTSPTASMVVSSEA